MHRFFDRKHVMYQVTGFDTRNGGIKPLKVTLNSRERDPAKLRALALRELVIAMDAGGRLIDLHGIQFWEPGGGILWVPVMDEPLFRDEVTHDELFAD